MTKELIINLISRGRDALIRTAEAVPDDKLNWRPMDAGRTVLDLLGDAAQAPAMVSKMLENPGEFVPSREMFQQLAQERADWTRDESIERLRSSCEKLFAQIEAMPDEELAREITLPFGGGMTMPLAGWVMLTYRSITNRFAQINYIQTLYGDLEPH